MTLRRETIFPKPKNNLYKVKTTMGKAKTLGQKKTAIYSRFGFTDAIEETFLLDAVT
jgi:hypothetical protein